MAVINAGSKVISLARDATVVAVLGLTSAADRLQVCAAIGSAIAGVVGTSSGYALASQVSRRPGVLGGTRKALQGTAAGIGALLLALTFQSFGSEDSGFVKLLPILIVAGLADSISMTALLSLNAANDLRVPAAVMGAQGALTLVGVAILGLTTSVSTVRIALVIAIDACIVSQILAWRFARQSDDSDVGEGVEVSSFVRVWGASAWTYGMAGLITTVERVVASRIPGGAALYTVIQRVANIPAGLVLQPLQALVLPALASEKAAKKASQAVLRFSVSVFRLAVLTVGLVGLLFNDAGPIGHLRAFAPSDVAATFALLVIVLPFSNLSAVAVRDWLVNQQPFRMIVPYGALGLTAIVGVVSPVRGIASAAGVMLVGQAVQAATSISLSDFLRRIATDVANRVGASGGVILEGGLSVAVVVLVVLGASPAVCGATLLAWLCVSFGIRPRRATRLLSDIFPREFR